MGSGPLPAAWSQDELLLDERDRWTPVSWSTAEGALCVLFDPVELSEGRMLFAVGTADVLHPLLDSALSDPTARTLSSAWIATDALPAVLDRLRDLGLRSNRTGWEWMVIREQPTVVPAEARLRELTPEDREAAAACLAVANPTTEARPLAEGERWWGVFEPAGLLGVIGAEPRPGAPGGRGSWHLHGLGVRPGARGQGLGGALTAGVARRLLADGADWVSLGMWDDNTGARRIYHRLGFRTVHRLVTLHRH